MITINDYYFNGTCFKLKNKYSVVIKSLVIGFLFTLSLLYINPAAEANFSTISFTPQERTQLKEYWNYFTWVKQHSKLNDDDAEVLTKALIKYSSIYKINKNLLLSVIMVESGFNPYAVSKAGAVGLTQVMLNYHKEKMDDVLTEELYFNPFDIETNIMLGARILHEYKGDLQRYNGNNVDMRYTTLVLNTKRIIDKQIPNT